ncbi:HTH domain-containing protein [Dyadobacter sp. SG02]|nr:HTH domain-containing protein [Dyadobacter sp. SG02]
MAEFERDLIRERNKAGLSAARPMGRMGGKPKGLSKAAMSKAHAAKALYDKKDKTGEEIGKALGISRATVYRYIKEIEQQQRFVKRKQSSKQN